MPRTLFSVLLGVLVATAGACREETRQITAVRIVVQFSSPSIDHLRLSLESLDGAALLPPTVRPEGAGTGARLSSPQDLIVYLDDDRAGSVIRCRVEGLNGNARITSGTATATVVRRKVVPCTVTLSGSGDGGPPLDGPPGQISDGGTLADGPSDDSQDAGATDGSDGDLPGDVGPAPPDGGVDLPPEGPPADAPPDLPPDITPDVPPDLTPDLPADIGVEIDMAPDLPPPPPPGCSDGQREAFLDTSAFRTVAGCGAGAAPVSYAQAIQLSPTVCQPAWRWCTTADVGQLPALPRPDRVAGPSCAWLDDRPAVCNQQVEAHGQAACAGGVVRTQSTAGPASGLCTGLLGCAEPWKLAIAIDDWGTVSVRDRTGCQDHATLLCAGELLSSTSCWIACCPAQ
jgi:hypothetical protein